MTLETKPISQQLKDRSFWDALPPEGAEYDGFEFSPRYSVLRDGKPINFKTDNGKILMNSFFHEMAVKEVQRLSKEHDNITLKITGYSESFIRRDEYLTA